MRKDNVNDVQGFALDFAGGPETIWTHLVLVRLSWGRA